MKDDQIIACIDCIISMWHKYQKFKEHVNTLSLTYEEICVFILNKLEKYDSLSNFIDESIKPRLNTSTKSYTKNVWSLGYITSSISEAHNSNIKHLLGSRALTLCEMRDVITNGEKKKKNE